MEKIRLLPGDLNDDNREYLPEAIKGSKMVVNENGNSSQVYPENLKEYKCDIVKDGIEDTWYVYVPKSYDPSKKTPLVFSMHGGLMTGWGQCIYTSWSHVADKEGFIVVFPDASGHRMWMIEIDNSRVEEITTSDDPAAIVLNKPTGKVTQYHDVKLVMALLDQMKQEYNIDEGRVYIQGMSMGNAMTSQVVRYLGQKFAGGAGSGCPTNNKLLFAEDNSLINEGGPLDIWQSRLEHDNVPGHYGEDVRPVVIGNINYWRRLNGAMTQPKISIHGEKNLVLYEGSKANVMLMDVYNRDHGQTFDDAQYIWDFMFSGVYRDESGILRHENTNRSFTQDRNAIALTEGAQKALVNGKPVEVGGTVFRREKLKYHGLEGGSIVRGSYLYAPVSFLTEVFEGTVIDDGLTAKIRLKDGRELTFAHGCIGCTIDNCIESMSCDAICVDEKLYVPLEWFCGYLYNWHVSAYDNTEYATDHYSHLSKYTSWLISDILKDTESDQRGMGPDY